MDLSEILGQQQGSDLNSDLAAVTPAGDSVFSKPFGAATAFRTEKGAVRVAFVFDPHATFDEFSILASINTDYMDIVREEISKFLLKPDELAPRKSNEQEVAWESIKKNLPQEVLAANVFDDPENLKEYIDLVKARARAVFREDELLWQKLSNDNFSFCIRIAIDAFYNKNVASKSVDGKGILTIRIDGGEAALTATRHLPPEPSPTPATAAEPSPRSRRKAPGPAASPADTRKEDMQLLAQLTEQLHMADLEEVATVREKSFPDSTDDFFEAITRWFSVVVATRTRKLEAETSTNPLYQ